MCAEVGAHAGVCAGSAATRAPGMIDVRAIEAHPDNVTRLAHGVALNGLDGAIEVIAAAAGAAPGTAPLVANSTMGNSLYGVGLHGIAQRIEPPDEIVGDASTRGAALPRSLAEAITLLDDSATARSLLGDAFVDHYLHTRRWEVAEHHRAVTDWELHRYFESV